jgi:hypothetical protein
MQESQYTQYKYFVVDESDWGGLDLVEDIQLNRKCHQTFCQQAYEQQ